MLPKIVLVACLAIGLKTQAQINPAKIDIIRNKSSVSPFFGKTDPEVAYGLAWAHA